MSTYTLRGPLGSLTNPAITDKGTISRSHSLSPNILLEPTRQTPIPSSRFKPQDKFRKKLKVRNMGIYRELGLAGQIAEKFLSLPYRKGNIEFNSGKLKGKGLVCTSFAKIFGALWFSGDPLKQMRLVEKDEDGKVKKQKKGEPAPSPARVYAREYGTSIVSKTRLKFEDLDWLDRSRLYAIVTYKTEVGEKTKDGKKSRQHIWFLIFSKKLKDWLRIESTGWALGSGGTGPGPGIYRLKATKKAKKRFYEVWDWGPAYKPRNPDIDNWEFT